MDTIRVVLAEDHAIIRRILREIIERTPHLCIVGEAANGKEAIECVERSSPDVLVLDIDMPLVNGTEVIREVTKRDLPVKILIVTAHTDPYFIQGALEDGVSGYFAKDDLAIGIGDAIKRVANGEKNVLSPTVVAMVGELL